MSKEDTRTHAFSALSLHPFGISGKMSEWSGDGQQLPTPDEFFEPSDNYNTDQGAEALGTDASVTQQTVTQQTEGATSSIAAPGADAKPDSAPLQPVPCMPADFLLKAAARQGHRVPTDTEQQRKLLQKLSHLHINGLGLQELQSLRLCPRLQVLYIYDNQLTSISSIASSRLITHLYAQNNKLSSLGGLEGLTLLQKLYLQRNALAVIDQLTGAARLEELHVSDQHPPQQWQQMSRQRQPAGQQHMHGDQQRQQQHEEPPAPKVREQCQQQAAGEAAAGGTGGLFFDPASLQAISGSLRVLAAANCGIHDPAPLAILVQLRMLDLANNDISKLDTLQPVLAALQHLQELDLRGNPCVQHEPNLKYRDYIILLAADSLALLDGEAVPAAHRVFLLGLHLNKLKAQLKAEQQQQQQQHGHDGQQLETLERQQPEGPLLKGEHQQLAGRLAALPSVATNAGLGACMGAEGSGVSLAGTGMKLHPVRPPAVRPTAAGGFNVSSARIAAVLSGPNSNMNKAGQRHSQ